jgi:hypothetical protein
LDGLADLLKLPARIFAAIAAVAALILFAPAKYLQGIGLDGLAKEYRFWVGLVFALSVAIFLVEVIASGWKMCREWWKAKKAAEAADPAPPKNPGRDQERARHAKLSGLTSDEKEILRLYVEQDVRALTFGLRDGRVMGLVAQGILHRPSQMLDFEAAEVSMQFLIQPWALTHLREHPELLE